MKERVSELGKSGEGEVQERVCWEWGGGGEGDVEGRVN